ncbi:flagellar hook-associated protein 3 [Comamonas sp. NLF-1-9]|uniref:flagellin N-terminal helical domain-containing protein n=1 Tax=Comamonas sp. NLF-1-9 TaxID=2853163 RepID=UPI001C494E61|nr:flagellar hook-associated protein 3 [Comamonas sp. NLF-1-9]QXL84248.1 flagellar hook-associated protein 3 [Comamonas sp. NLF-1-9]
MADSFYRVGTATMYDSATRNLGMRQKSLVDLQENLTSGKRVVRPSDDPVAAAQAERAMTRINRIQAEQRQLDIQRGNVALAESTLGDAVGVVQEMRQLLVAAGNGSLKPEDRQTYALQLQSLQDQLKEVINRKDVNGMPLLGALGSALAPFVGPVPGAPDYLFQGLPGQAASQGSAVATQFDGHAALMFDPQRDGMYRAALGNANPAYPLDGRLFNTSVVKIANAAQIQPNAAPGGAPHTYQVQFGAVTTHPDGSYDISYTISSSNPAFVPPGPLTAANIVPGQPFTLPISITDPGGATLQFEIKGLAQSTPAGLVPSPAPGDTVTISATASLMSTMDDAVAALRNAGNSNAGIQAVGQALGQLDYAMDRLHNLRGYAGELLNRADRISGDQQTRSIQLEEDRSRAEDLDMVKGISDFQNANVGYQAALQSYAMVQKLSLFNYIG